MHYKDICFVINQYGSVFYLYPVLRLLKKKKIKIKIFSDLKLKTRARFDIKYEPTSIKKISKYKIIITDIVVQNSLCKKITNIKKSYVVQFLDGVPFWKEKFILNGKYFFGDEIWSLDNFTTKKLKLITKGKCKIYKIGHPGNEHIMSGLKKNRIIKKNKILIVLQPLQFFINNFNQNSIINYFQSIFNSFKKKYNYFFLLHPSMENKHYKNLKNIIRFKDNKEINNFTHVIGYFSTIIILSFLLKINTAIIYNNKATNKGTKDLLERYKIQKLQNARDIKNFIDTKVDSFRKISRKEEAKFKIYNRILKLQKFLKC